jgi:hypothetical protein
MRGEGANRSPPVHAGGFFIRPASACPNASPSHYLRIEAAKLSFVSIHRGGVSFIGSPESAPLKTCSRKQVHKLVQYPIRKDTAQAVTTSLKLISLQTHSSPKRGTKKRVP